MRFLGALVTALTSGATAWKIAGAAAGGLPDMRRIAVTASVTVLGAGMGLLVGATVGARIADRGGHLPLFTFVTAAVAGGVVGSVSTLLILTLYLVTYAPLPDNLVDWVLYVISYPALGGLAFFIGAIVWAVPGFLAGEILALVSTHGRRIGPQGKRSFRAQR